MQCPVPHTKGADVPAGHPSTEAKPTLAVNPSSSASSSRSPSPALTPSFAPNAPASAVPSENVTLQALLYESGAGDGIRPATVDEWPLPDDLDFTRPVSELLRKGTQRAHVAAEHSDGAVALTTGQLELQEYVRWLAVIWRLYDTLETNLSVHATNSVLAPTFNPVMLARAPEIAKDITYLLTRLPKTIAQPSKKPLALAASMPLPPFPLPPFLEEVFVFTPPALQVYLDRLNECAGSDTMAPRLLAHAYVRYLGDLSGGQVIGARLRKAYGLPGLDGRRFYNFEMGGDTSAAEAGEETVGERKKKLNDVKAWYRTGMDEGAGEDAKLKAALVREANVAFLLNTHLFSLITPPPAQPARYYDKLAIENERRKKMAGPGPTLVQKAMRIGYLIAAIFIAVFLMEILRPYAEPYAVPAYNKYVMPIIEEKLVPLYNDRFVPWWDDVAPILNRHLVAQSRRLI